jgi:hypothetical protein
MNLFEKKKWVMHSGEESNFKIECDALTLADWDTIAYLIAKNISFVSAVGVPQGGLKFAEALREYKKSSGPLLIVDDVLTTGASMEKMKDIYHNVIGIVLFARGRCPDWVTPIFQMNEWFTLQERGE